MSHKLQNQPLDTQVQDLTSDDLDQVRGGGTTTGGVLVTMGDGSVRVVDAADYALWRRNYGNGG